jgi:ABC-type phosphate/phosphonate transport system substrate-binding protein
MALALLAAIAMCPGPGNGSEQADSISLIRMGASTSLVSAEVNENDARAAIKTWADTLSRAVGLRLEYLPEVLLKPDDLQQKIRQWQLDAFSSTTAEYEQVAMYTDPDSLIVDQSYLNGGEEYLILAHADSGIRSVGDLKGRTLVRFSGTVMSLSSDWLVTLLGNSQLGLPDAFFGAISSNGKLARVVLPVFFRQTDACLVTRRGFETMGEMNPQLLNKLRLIATSPKVVPVVVAMHKNCTQRQKQEFKAAMAGLGDSPAGRQILALFGSRKVMTADSSILTSAVQLIKSSNAIRGHRPGGGR